jgi:hypothetical protein
MRFSTQTVIDPGEEIANSDFPLAMAGSKDTSGGDVNYCGMLYLIAMVRFSFDNECDAESLAVFSQQWHQKSVCYCAS